VRARDDAPMRAVLAVAAVMAASGTAAAENGMGPLFEGVVTTGFVLELGIPDARLVFGADDHRWVLSWPIVFTSLKVVRGETVAVGLLPFVEPQYQATREAVRIGGGVRATLFRRDREFQAVPLLEAGGLIGQDGSGWFAGGGLAVGVPELGVTLGLVGRVVTTDSERRYDLALDFQLPLSSDEY
jgi:hypothetical protein